MTSQSIYRTPEGEKAVLALYDSFLAKWPVAHETLNIPTRQGDTFVVASGDPKSPALVLLHGAGTNSAIWAGDVPLYSRHYRTYAVDLIGEAGRSAPSRPPWEGPAFVEWLEDVLAGLGLEKASLAGISQGGWAALKFAVEHPERVEKLALICPGGVTPDKLSFVFKAVFYSMLGKRGTGRMARLLYGEQEIPAGVDEVSALLMRHFKSRIGKLPLFSDEQLQCLTMPTLLVGGTLDALRDNQKIGERLRQFLPRLDIALIPGAGHAVLNTADRILAFLAPGVAVEK